MKTTAADTALAFIDCINMHELHRIVALVTEDHLFIDARGNQARGRRQLERSWRAYFEWFPDYSIAVDQAFANGNIAVVTGSAMGTCAIRGRMNPETRWKVPSAWQGVMRNGRIAEWRVYADNEPVWKAMRKKRHPERSVFPVCNEIPSAPGLTDAKVTEEPS